MVWFGQNIQIPYGRVGKDLIDLSRHYIGRKALVLKEINKNLNLYFYLIMYLRKLAFIRIFHSTFYLLCDKVHLQESLPVSNLWTALELKGQG